VALTGAAAAVIETGVAAVAAIGIGAAAAVIERAALILVNNPMCRSPFKRDC